MTESLNSKTRKGFLWSAIERFSVQGIQFILGVVMARILSPEDYGIIGMLAIFLALSQSLIDSGFSNALIQKKNRNQEDYSTVFYFNIILGVFLYFILFFASSFLANFYDMPILSPITKVIALNLFINSLVIVQKAKLTIELNFKIQANVSVIAVLLSGILGLILAVRGWGVWALVYQSIAANFLSCVLLWIYARWRPSLLFSWHSFKSLFQFGSKLLITGLYGPIFENINTLVIGKFYSSSILGNYTRAATFAQLPSSNITSIIGRVSFPVLSDLQDNDEKLSYAYRKLIRVTSFIVFPLMMGLSTIASPLIEVLLTSKWQSCAIYLQLLCFSMLLYPVCAFNINLLLVKGMVKTHLKLDLIKKIVLLFVLFITANISVNAICIGQIISALFSWIITAYYSGRLIKYSFIDQVIELLPSFLISLLMLGIVSFINIVIGLDSTYLLMVDIVIYFLFYIGISYFFNRVDFHYVMDFLKRRDK